MKRLTKPEKLLNEQMLALLKLAADHKRFARSISRRNMTFHPMAWWEVLVSNPMHEKKLPPKRWHDIGKLPESRKAAELLAKRGVIEIRDPMNQYRLKPK